MKTIFIATDFSQASHIASKYAVELASAMGANIVLFHAYSVPLSIPESYVIVSPEDVKKSSEDYLLEEVVKLRKSTFQPIDILAVEGGTVETIINTSKKYDNCIIVVGMKGEGKSVRKFFGSTTSALARKSYTPMLIVPESATFSSLNRIALAVDDNINEHLQQIDVLKGLGETYKSKIFVVRVFDNDMSVVDELAYRSKSIISKLMPLDVEFKFPRGDDVTIALENFADDNSIDLLTIIPHYHSFFERLFSKSETRQLLFHSHIPLLLLPDIKVEIKERKKIMTHQKNGV